MMSIGNFVSPDGSVPESAEEQAALCFTAIGACLGAAAMSFRDNAYVTDRAYLSAYMAVRETATLGPRHPLRR